MKSKTGNKFITSIICIVVLAICLCIATVAMVYSKISLDDNTFDTGTVKIDLNGGQPIVSMYDFSFAPGETIKRDFYIKNESSTDVYYRLYFVDVDGKLSDVVSVKILDGDEILYEGSASDLNNHLNGAAEGKLAIDQKKDLTIYFNFPDDCSNDLMNEFLSFNLCADAVQTKNNANKLFN